MNSDKQYTNNTCPKSCCACIKKKNVNTKHKRRIIISKRSHSVGLDPCFDRFAPFFFF